MHDCTLRSSGKATDAGRRVSFCQQAARVLLVSYLVAGGGLAARAEELRWQLQPGQPYRLQVERTVRQNSPLAQWIEDTRYQLVWTVASIDPNGVMEIVQTLADVKHTMRWGESDPIEYDSASGQEVKGDAANLARHWKPLLATERKFRLTPRGQFLAAAVPTTPTPSTPVTGPVTSGATGSETPGVSPTVPIPTGPPAATSLPTSTPTAPLSSAVPAVTPVSPTTPITPRPVYWVLPSESIEIGFQWTDTQTLPLLDRQDAWQVTTAYTYQGHEVIENRELDRIQVETRWKTAPGSTSPGGLTLERQNGTGVIWFDHDAGYLSSSQMSQELIARTRRPDGTTFQSEISTSVRVRMEPVRAMPTGDDPIESVETPESVKPGMP